VAYAVALNGANSQETVIHTFCTSPHCADGAEPKLTPLVGLEQDVFGAASNGGDLKNLSTGGGTIFKLTGNSFQTIAKLCKKPDCIDGVIAQPGFVSGKVENYFGTAGYGPYGGGIVFEMKP
jgi:hypothetical protein